MDGETGEGDRAAEGEQPVAVSVTGGENQPQPGRERTDDIAAGSAHGEDEIRVEFGVPKRDRATPSKPWPASLRVKSLVNAPGVLEMTWSFTNPDGRATFELLTVENELRCRWRRVGDHALSSAAHDPCRSPQQVAATFPVPEPAVAAGRRASGRSFGPLIFVDEFA